MDQGLPPSTLIDDTPISYDIPGSDKPWEPANYDKKFYGPLTLREAITYSRNVVTVKLAEQIGIDRVIGFARLLGIYSPLERNLSLALGSSGLSPLELTSAIGVYANQGVRIEPMAIRSIVSASGQVIEQHQPEGAQVITPETAYLVTNMMEDVIQKGTGQGAKVLERPLAGKTGTTNDFTDAWFVGFAPNLVTGVWVGFDSMKPLGSRETGARVALPIWVNYMGASLRKLPVENFTIPEDIVFAKVDPDTERLALPTSTHFVVEVFRKGTEPTEFATGSPFGHFRSGRLLEAGDTVD
jgi:penicillin-binding protein 1A